MDDFKAIKTNEFWSSFEKHMTWEQILEIENLVNEFSDFARMPKPIIKKSDLLETIANLFLFIINYAIYLV